MIELKELRKSYKTGDFMQKALDGVSISFRDNEFVAVLGPSGSGKTTLLNVLGGLDHADTGELVINGVSTKDYKSADWDTYRNHHIGFIFQSYNLIPHQSVLSNVELALTLSGIPRAERKARAQRELERVGLGDHINKRPSQLSGGQMQRVAIARALVNDPDIVLADEPTGALDTETGIQVMDLLSEIASDRLVIMVTHNPELAYKYANRIVKLHDGQISDDSNPFNPAAETQAELFTQGAVVAAASATPVVGAMASQAAGTIPAVEAATGAAAGATQPLPEDQPQVQDGETVSKGRKKHASMSFLTALSLSFNNLMTKKGRTFLTAFAGSIGIIGIAAILALSNGVNNYIAKVEEDTLSSTPLTITESSFDITSIMTQAGSYSASGKTDSDTTNSEGSKIIPESTIMADILSDVKNNDLKSFRAFLESDASGVDKYTNAIVYNYGIVPQIYKEDTSDGVKRLNPGSLSGIVSNGINSMSMFSAMGTANSFQEMLDDPALLEAQYDVVTGRWPTQYDECVLVLNSNGGLSDYTLYSIGVLNPDELEDLLKKAISSEDMDVPNTRVDFTEQEALETTFKIVNKCNMYTKASDGKTWTNRSNDEDYMKDQIAKGEDLKIVGIIKPHSGSSNTSLDEGVAYRHDLVLHLMEEAADSPVVQAQQADPETDIFTGKTFKELEDEAGSSFDMSSIFSVDADAMARAFGVDTFAIEAAMSNAMTNAATGMDASSLFSDVPTPDFSNMEIDPSAFSGASAEQVEAMEAAMQQASNAIIGGFMSYIASNPGSYDPANPASMAQAYSDYQQTAEYNAILSAIAEASASESQDASARMQQAFAQMIQAQMDDYMTNQFVPYLQGKMGKMLESYAVRLGSSMAYALAEAMGGSVSFDVDAFTSAISINLDQNELTSMLTSFAQANELSYENNLTTIGYADITDPQSINIYAKSFDDKQRVEDIIDGYNHDMETKGDPDKAISYSDIMGVLMRSVTDIINMISMVLIAFVAISLVVSSIMIGIITYISVLERKKEIGILRAMGASKGNIANIFNAETVIEGLMSGVFAVLIVMLLSIPINAIVNLVQNVENIMVLPITAAIILIVISVMLTFAAGIMPAMNAARRDPVEALRSE